MVNRINSFDAQKVPLSYNFQNQEIDELKDRMDSQTSFQFENLKKAYNTQVNVRISTIGHHPTRPNLAAGTPTLATIEGVH
jgi:hypothetical protein